MTATDLAAWIPTGISLILILIAVIKVVPDLRSSDAGAAKGYMEAAQAAASELRDSQKEAKLESAEWKLKVSELEDAIAIIKRKVAVLEDDKARLEAEKAAQMQRIVLLEKEKQEQQVIIVALTERVQRLEKTLRDKNIPIPKDTGPLSLP